MITAYGAARDSDEQRYVPVPASLAELRGPLEGVASLPGRLFWSGLDPRNVLWDLADPRRRRDFYEVVLLKGTLDDICALVNGPELVWLWDEMYLPPWVREAWHPVVMAAEFAA